MDLSTSRATHLNVCQRHTLDDLALLFLIVCKCAQALYVCVVVLSLKWRVVLRQIGRARARFTKCFYVSSFRVAAAPLFVLFGDDGQMDLLQEAHMDLTWRQVPGSPCERVGA